MTPATFALETCEPARPGEPVRVSVTGDLDATNADEFATRTRDALGDRTAVLDVSTVRFIDSAGFAALHRLSDTGHVAILIRPDSHLRRSATLMGLPYHSLPDAAARSARRPL